MTLLIVGSVIVIFTAALRGLWSPCGLSMISQITPVSERAKGHTFAVTATWFVLGGIAGGASLGAVLALGAWGLGAMDVDAQIRYGVLALAGVVTIASDLKIFGVSLPIHPRQVNETWLRRLRAWAYASGFGWQIGTGFATYIMTAGVYLTAALGIATADPAAAFVVGTTFGLARGLQVLVASRATTPERLQVLHARIDRAEATSLRIAIAGQVALVAALGAVAPLGVIVAASGAVALMIGIEIVRAGLGRHTSTSPSLPTAPDPM